MIDNCLRQPLPLLRSLQVSRRGRDVHFRWRRRFSAWRLRLTAGILWPTPRKRRMVSMNLVNEIGFDK
jgi:hypothetical protein